MPRDDTIKGARDMALALRIYSARADDIVHVGAI